MLRTEYDMGGASFNFLTTGQRALAARLYRAPRLSSLLADRGMYGAHEFGLNRLHLHLVRRL